MGLLKNKKGVESLPLRYIIIALVAALVIGIALQFVGVLRGGTISSANKINKTLAEKTTCELDEEKPIISDWTGNIDCNATTNIVSISSVKITDDCGVEWAKVELENSTTNDFNGLADLSIKSEENNTWYGTFKFYGNGKNVTEEYNITSGDIVIIWAKDKTNVGNYAVEKTVKCEE